MYILPLFFTSIRYCWASGPIWDFRNARARNYYVDQVIGEVGNESAAINMVFFDGGQPHTPMDL